MAALKQNLTPEQIEDVVNSLPPCLAATKRVADKLREQIQNKLRLQLKDVKLVNKPEALEKLKEMIYRQHYNSLVQPGEAVGIRAAEGLSQPITQMTLNAFHTAGSSANSASGIDAIEDLYNVRKNLKFQNSSIHFKNKNLIYEEIIDMRREIKGITLNDVLVGREIMKYEKDKEPYWYRLFMDLTKTHNEFKIDKIELENKDDKRDRFLRLKFDQFKLYSYNLTLSNIAERISRAGIFCIPSPTSYGFIDIFINNELAKFQIERNARDKGKESTLGITIYNTNIFFIQMFLGSEFNKTIINGGIEGITEIFPVEVSVNDCSIKNEDYLGEGKWRLNLDKIQMALKGVPMSKLLKLIEMCNIQVLNHNPDYIEVYGENNVVGLNEKETDKSPRVTINKIVAKEKKDFEAIVEKQKENNIFIRRQVPELLRTARYIYASSNGSNFIRLLGHPKVDSQISMCTNSWEILASLGIEAARNFLIREYIKIIDDNGKYVNPRHIVITADFQTTKGTLLSITSKSAARQNIGPLAQASFEHPMEAFIDAAAFGKIEEIKSTSTSIFVGKRMILGTGSFKARIDSEALKEASRKRDELRKANEEKFANFSKVDVNKFLNTLNEDSELLNPEEEVNDTVGSIFGATTVSGIADDNFEEFKFRNPVPKAPKVSGAIKLPEFVTNLIDITDSKVLGIKPLSTKSLIPKISLTPTTSAKMGMPAIPNTNITQMVSASPAKFTKVSASDLDSFDF